MHNQYGVYQRIYINDRRDRTGHRLTKMWLTQPLPAPLPHDPSLVTPLERFHNKHPNPNCRSYKLLGIHLDETLSFQYHADFLRNKLSKSLFCINRAKNFLDPQSLKMLYFALFHSNLLYCIGTLSTMSKTNANKIGKMQNKAIRAITNSKNRQSASLQQS